MQSLRGEKRRFSSESGSLLEHSMAGLVVRPRARILHGHDWVYASEVLKVFGNPADGDVISIKDGRDKLLGLGDLQLEVPNRRATIFATQTGA